MKKVNKLTVSAVNKTALLSTSLALVLHTTVTAVETTAPSGSPKATAAPAKATAEVQTHKDTLIATVDNFKITQDQLAHLEALEHRGQRSNASPAAQFSTIAKGLDQLVKTGIVAHLMKKNDVKLTDEQILHEAGKLIEAQLNQQKQQLMQFGILKPETAEKDFEEMMKKQLGKGVAEVKKQQLENIKEELKKPQARAGLEVAFGREALINKFAHGIKISDEEVKNHYTTYVFKRIIVQPSADGKETAKAVAEKILQEIKGGLSFEQAIDKYSKENPEEGKKLSENTLPVPLNVLKNQEPKIMALANLKPGELSSPIEHGDNVGIYKLIKIETNLPKDYEKNKAAVQLEIAKQPAEEKLEDEIQKLGQSNLIHWDSPGYKLVYDVVLLGSEPALAKNKKLLHERILQIAQKVKEVKPVDPGSSAANLVQYLTLQELWHNASPEEKAKIAEQRIHAIKTLMSANKIKNITLHLELARALADKKDPGAGQELVEAAKLSIFKPNNEAAHKEITTLLATLKTAKLITPEQVKLVETEQARWNKEKTTHETEMKKREEEKKAEKVKPAPAKPAPQTPPAPQPKAQPAAPAKK